MLKSTVSQRLERDVRGVLVLQRQNGKHTGHGPQQVIRGITHGILNPLGGGLCCRNRRVANEACRTGSGHRLNSARLQLDLRFGRQLPTGPLPARVDGFHTLIDWRVGGKQTGYPAAEEHVARFSRVLVLDGTAYTAQPSQGVGNSGRVAGELHGRSIGQIFPLPRHHRLQQAAKERTHSANHNEGEPGKHQGQTAGVFFLPGHRRRMKSNSNNGPPQIHQSHQAKDQTHQPDVQPHIAVLDVAEFMSHDALQFVAGQSAHAPFGEAQHCVLGP